MVEVKNVFEKNEEYYRLNQENYFDGDSIAVVGNSGKLLDSRQGISIDMNDRVMRLNQAPMKGYAEDVGACEHLRFINGSTVNSDWIKQVENKTLLPTPQSRRRYNRLKEKAGEANHLLFLSGEMKNQLLQFQTENVLSRISTGMMAILISKCLYDEVNVYGFDSYSGEYSLHYWEDHDDYSDHQWDTENHLLLKWNATGLINLK